MAKKKSEENDLGLARKLIVKCLETQNPKLDLGRCGLTDLGDLPELFDCSHLEKLILSDFWWDPVQKTRLSSQNSGPVNHITSIPRELTGLENLSTLIFGGDYGASWDISDFNMLNNLANLTTLRLDHCKISNLNFLASLTNLSSLGLDSNRIKDASPISFLTELEYLDLDNNQISDIEPLSNLVKLRYLSLRDNSISDLSPISRLIDLNCLNLSDNTFVTIPEFLFRSQMEPTRHINSHDNQLSLGGNPIESPPLQIIEQGRQSVLDWFAANKTELNEIKVILIGDPKAGKTSLLRRLKTGTFDPNEVQTDGVNIEDIEFGTTKTFENQTLLHELTGHFWDFGGQEIMNATHQFFLTSRCVYILVLDARKDDGVAAQVRQWTKRIKATGGSSSIIVVANQIDVNPGFGFENEYELQEEFPQIKAFIKASCATAQNLEKIKITLEELIPKAEFFNTEIDERWISIKEKLQEETAANYFLDETRFMEICQEFGLKKRREQRNAINFLHDLGLVLHFEEIDLSEYYVLNPYWITYGVYQIVTSTFAGEQNGIVDMAKLDYIVNREEEKKESYQPTDYKKIDYSANERRFLVDILNLFKLCFYLPDRSKFIIPDLLDTNEPIKITKPIRNAEDSIRFVYEYDYLPRSILPHIMVDAHQIITEKWRTGCILESDDCAGLLTVYQNRISITVLGEHKKKREFMAVIRFLIDSINQELTDPPNMLIPLPGIDDAYVDYEELLDRERDGDKEYKIYKPVKTRFEIAQLLDGVATRNELLEISKKVDAVLSNTESIMSKLDSQFSYLVEQLEDDNLHDELIKAIKELNKRQSKRIAAELLDGIQGIIDQSSGALDDRLAEIHADIQKTSDVQMKLKLAVPFINVLGINLETEFDIKNWATEMYEKYEIRLLKLLRYL